MGITEGSIIGPIDWNSGPISGSLIESPGPMNNKKRNTKYITKIFHGYYGCQGEIFPKKSKFIMSETRTKS